VRACVRTCVRALRPRTANRRGVYRLPLSCARALLRACGVAGSALVLKLALHPPLIRTLLSLTEMADQVARGRSDVDMTVLRIV
jgi:hypothetical protein